MRCGEVIALQWKHVDLRGGTIHVEQSITSYGEVKDPKSDAGKRDVSIDAKTVGHLTRWQAFQVEEMALLGLRQGNDTPVCCSDKAEYLRLTNFSPWWRAFCADNGFSGLKFHELRHTQATQLIANGMDIKTVQNRLGHASPTLTVSFYAHALPENDQRAAALIGNLFSQPAKADGRGEKSLRVAL